MTNYEEMTDGQINFEAAKILFSEFKLIPNDDDVSVFVSESTDRFDFMSIRNSAFNPCHDPSHAWPIIIENKISMAFNWEVAGLWTAFVARQHYESTEENPLRAAMICFLKMKDADVSE